MPNLYVISGCNGAGKTTASFTVLPEMLNCDEFVNADEIARGLSPFNPDKSAIQAGRIMLGRIQELMEKKMDFAFETTLSTKSYTQLIQRARKIGYTVTLLFFYLDSPELAKKRVEIRVQEGGHNIPEPVIIRRYYAGIKNLFELYLPICDYWMIFNNSMLGSELIAEGYIDGIIDIKKIDTFEVIKQKTHYDKKG